MKPSPRVSAIIILVLLLLAGCSGGGDPTAAPEPIPTASPTTVQTESPARTSSPTESPGSTPIPTESPTQSATPTPTSSPTATATQTATPTTTPRGPQQGTCWTVTITRVIDGDTVEARFPNGEIDTLRLLGVDTPETTLSRVSPEEFEGISSTTAGQDHLFNWGQKASEFAENELSGETVRIEVDPEADRRGGFGRLLVYIYVDGQNFNKRLLSEGYARMYDSTFSMREEFQNLEETARDNEVGLWDFGGSTPTTAPTGNQVGSLAIAQIHEDATGNDHENENDEYLVFENTGDAPLDLSGWTVIDAADHTYHFPSGFTLDPGQQVTLYTGSGTNTASELYWGSDSAIWNNGGDTIIVRNDAGETVLEETYE